MLDLSVIDQEQSSQCLVYHGDMSEVSILLGFELLLWTIVSWHFETLHLPHLQGFKESFS